MRIEFSPPDITQLEIDEVVDTLKSTIISRGNESRQFLQWYHEVDEPSGNQPLCNILLCLHDGQMPTRLSLK